MTPKSILLELSIQYACNSGSRNTVQVSKIHFVPLLRQKNNYRILQEMYDYDPIQTLTNAFTNCSSS